jgi:serine/threonine protein kinase
MSHFALLPAKSLIANRYRIIEILSDAPHAHVYKVKDTHNQNAVQVVKEISSCFLDLFQVDFMGQASVLANLNHPTLLRQTDFFQQNEHGYLVMEHITANSLESVLPKTNMTKTLIWISTLCEVLIYLHNQPKPVIFGHLYRENIFIDRDGGLKLAHASITKEMLIRSLEFSGYCLGIKHTMSFDPFIPPELWMTVAFSPLSDIYNLGVVFWHLITGVHPIVMPFITDNLPFEEYAPQISSELKVLITKALQRNVDDRWQSVAELKAALEQTPEYAEYQQK